MNRQNDYTPLLWVIAIIALVGAFMESCKVRDLKQRMDALEFEVTMIKLRQ